MNSLENPSQIPVADHQDEAEKTYDTISFKSADGKEMKAVHLALEEDTYEKINSDKKVKVRGKSGVFTLSFEEYLARLGLDYDDYWKATKMKPDTSAAEILKDLHLKVIDKRTRVAEKKHKQFALEKHKEYDFGEETTHNHGPLFNKIINDLGIEGLESEEALPRVDYIEGIDEIISLDHRALETDGEEKGKNVIKIGIQRSFRDKGEDIKKDPIRFIPEDPEAGPIFRVFILEDLEDYIDMTSETTLYQKLLNIRIAKAKEQGLDPKTYAKGKRNQGLSTIDKVLPGGVKEQVARATRVLEEIKNQLNNYINSPSFDSRSKELRTALREQYEQIKIDDFLEAVEELATAA